MLEKVRLINDPILRTPCAPVPLAGMSHWIDSLLSTMNDTMNAEDGMGLAANQVGYSLRIFILKEGDLYAEYINPEFVNKTELVSFDGETCLSIPGVSAVTQRYRVVKLSWLDREGTKKEKEFIDIEAFAVQHEMDHLSGKLYIDQFGPVKRKLIVDKHKKFLRAISRG